MYNTFSIKKKSGKWYLTVGLDLHFEYTTWKEAIQKIDEILATWEET